jgi:hypothetical protein
LRSKPLQTWWPITRTGNIVFLTVAAMLVWRYFRRGGGIPMLRMMNTPMSTESGHEHAHGRA